MICLTKHSGGMKAIVRLPASKSISNRLLILQHHFGPSLQISGLSASDDTLLLSTLLTVIKQNSVSSQGLLRLDARNAGTVFRFLTALLAINPGHYLLTGSDRMEQRPVGPLVDALRELGADIEYAERAGYPPLFIKGRRMAGGKLTINNTLSSQFLSSLLLIGPFMENGLEISIEGESSSWPYVAMTEKLLVSIGVRLEEDGRKIIVYPKRQVEKLMTVESDWSSASFWYTMLALSGKGYVEFPGLFFTGLQGDEVLGEYFRPLGIVTEEGKEGTQIIATGNLQEPCILNFKHYPDIAMPVILAYAAANQNALFTGLDRLRFKESDRLASMTRELAKAGITLEKLKDDQWHARGVLKLNDPIDVDDSGDHRIAMTLACLAARGGVLRFRDPGVINKSYPGFWNDMVSAGFEISSSC